MVTDRTAYAIEYVGCCKKCYILRKGNNNSVHDGETLCGALFKTVSFIPPPEDRAIVGSQMWIVNGRMIRVDR